MSFSSSLEELVAQSSSGLVGTAARWKRVLLRDVAKVVNGFPFQSEFFAERNGIPVIRIRDVTSGRADTYYNGPIPNGFWVERGDIVVGMDGDFNCRIWEAEKALLNQRVCKIEPNPMRVDKRFLAYALPGYLSLINESTHSITVKHLSSKTIGQIPLPLPELLEQQRITAKLEELFARSRAAREELACVPRLVKRYKEAILNDAVSGKLTAEWRAGRGVPVWREAPIKEVGDVVTGFTPSTKERSRFFGGTTPFFKPTDLDAGYNVNQAREHLTHDGVSIGRLVPAGATLVTCIGATIGKTGFARVDCCTNQQINAVIPNHKFINDKWLY